MILALLGSLALAGTTSLGLGVGRHDSPRQVVLGVGPQLTHRALLDERWVVGGGVERIWLVAPSVGLRVEGGLQRSTGVWNPSVSAELATWLGRLVLLTTEDPLPPRLPPTSLRLRLRPLVFEVGESAEVSALELAPGIGLEAPLKTQAFGITVFAVGHRW